MNTCAYRWFLGAAAAAAMLCTPIVLPAQQLVGAGSTFVYPIMSRWGADFQGAHAAVTINYQSIGSGGGIAQVKAGTVDFGASDVALTDDQLKTMPPVIQLPESAGPVCITYNLAIAQPLHLTAEILSGIYLGAITNWNDPRIKAANPGVAIPEKPILVAHRSDGSGTTGIFTEYLSAVNPEWKSRVGTGTSVQWPAGIGGKGSEGVTGVVKQSEGAIGYVELSYANANHLPVAWIQNKSGRYIAPSSESTSAAIAAGRAILAKDVRTPIVDGVGPAVYPISGLTFLIIPQSGSDAAKRTALKKFISYIITQGQASATQLNYAPLPAAIQQLDQKLLAGLK